MAKGGSTTTHISVYGEVCRSRDNTPAFTVTRRGPSELCRRFMASFDHGLLAPRSILRNPTWRFKALQEPQLGGPSYPNPHKMNAKSVPTSSFYFLFVQVCCLRGEGDCIARWWFVIEPWTAEVISELDLSSWSARIVKSNKYLKN